MNKPTFKCVTQPHHVAPRPQDFPLVCDPPSRVASPIGDPLPHSVPFPLPHLFGPLQKFLSHCGGEMALLLLG